MANCEGDRSPMVPLRGEKHLTFMRRPGPEDLHFVRVQPVTQETLGPQLEVSLDSQAGDETGGGFAGSFGAERPIGPESFQPIEVFVPPSLKGETY